MIVVPDPKKGFYTAWPGDELFRIGRRMHSTGFCRLTSKRTNGRVPPKLADRAGDHCHLRIGVRPGIPGVGHQALDRPVLDAEPEALGEVR
jgi:hypothetical protein